MARIDKHNFIPTAYNVMMIVATMAILMRFFPKILGVMVLVLFLFYLSKVIPSR